MFSVILTGLTLGIVAKYIILGNYSSNFLVPIIVGIAGAAFAHIIGTNTGAFYTNEDPIGMVAIAMGSISLLAVYWGISYHRKKTLHYH